MPRASRTLPCLSMLLLLGCGAVRSSVPERGAVAGPAQVRLVAPERVRLVRTDAGPAEACTAPCDRALPEGTYRAVVPELPDSPPFALQRAARLEVEVRPAPPALLGAGATLGVLGGAGMVVGGLTAGLDALGNEEFAGAAAPGLITLAAGSAVLAGGLVCAFLSGTEVSLRELTTRSAVAF